MDRSDDELLRILGTDPGALEEFYRRHVRLVTAFAARRAHRPEEVGDVVAAVFLEVIERSDRYDGARGTAVGWLLAITSTKVADRRRGEARQVRLQQRVSGQRLLDPDDHARLEAQIDASRLAPALASAMDALPEGERHLLELVGEHGLSPAEASRALGIAPAAGRMRLARARRKVRSALATADRPARPPAAHAVPHAHPRTEPFAAATDIRRTS